MYFVKFGTLSGSSRWLSTKRSRNKFHREWREFPIYLNEITKTCVVRLNNNNFLKISLTQSEVESEYGRADTLVLLRHENIKGDNNDQRIHSNVPNNTLTLPSPWYEPEAVSIILYLSVVDEYQEATVVVPRTGVKMILPTRTHIVGCPDSVKPVGIFDRNLKGRHLIRIQEQL